MATHYLFRGDEITTRASVYAGEYMPYNQRPDGFGFDVYIPSYRDAEVFDADDDGFIGIRVGDLDDLVDVEAYVGPNEISHDHAACEDVLDNLDYEYDRVIGEILVTWED